jgi:hypothetical protein
VAASLTPKTNAERQKTWRDRAKVAAKGPEVRGIFAPKPHHTAIKEAARKAAAKLAKEPKT